MDLDVLKLSEEVEDCIPLGLRKIYFKDLQGISETDGIYRSAIYGSNVVSQGSRSKPISRIIGERNRVK